MRTASPGHGYCYDNRLVDGHPSRFVLRYAQGQARPDKAQIDSYLEGHIRRYENG